MSDRLDFTNKYYKEKALNKKNANYENGITSYQAFFICINNLDYGCLDNLCLALQNYYKDGTSLEEYYNKLQDLNSSDEFKKVALECAFNVIEYQEYLGTKIINGNFNASAWISHSLNEGKLCSILAACLGLNSDTAMKLGILHDIGRKKIHTFMHTILGYELLVDYGLEDEAIATLTHSFLPDIRKFNLNGSRCANCDRALDGLIVDENVNESFEYEENKDDITLFLEQYEYSMYDLILNISDLMAMSSGITSPFERVNDIYTRKTPDEKNQYLFLHRFICAMNKIMFDATKNIEYLNVINNMKKLSIQNLYDLFVITSDEFMTFYNSIGLNKSLNK